MKRSQIIRIAWFIRYGDEVFLVLGQAAYRLNMPWDNCVNKKAVIYAAHTTFDVRNMPLTG